MSRSLRGRRSLISVVAASLLTAACGVIQTFWIPRLLSVDAFGYWRAFLLYIGYAGLLHLGLVDGALLSWSKGGTSHHAPELILLRRSLKFIFVEHTFLVLLTLTLLSLAPSHILPTVLAAVTYAFLFNLVGVVQVFLQAHHRFTALALGMALPSLLFTFLVAGIAFTHITVNRFLIAYLAGWALTLLVLIALAYRSESIADETNTTPLPTTNANSPWQSGFSYISLGWSIMLANTGLGLMQSADRVTVNVTRPIHDFAIYSLSQSTIYVPVTILAAVSRVVFSYFARLGEGDRATVYRKSTRVLTLLWMLSLPYYYLVESVVKRFLPKYVPGLPAGRILLLSVLFISLVQIVQLNTYSLKGRQRQFFVGSLFAVALAFITAWIGSRMIGTLTAIAWSQVITAMLWWIVNEYNLRATSGVSWRDTAKILFGFCISAFILALAQRIAGSAVLSSLMYVVAVLPVCLLLFHDEVVQIAEMGLQPRERIA
jgi:O-antigen/teichoic acid export membrane protein